MTNDIFKAFSGYGKNSVAATKELVDLNGKLMTKILDNQVALANLYIEGSEKQLDVVSGTTDPKELLAAQTALVEEYSAKLSEFAESSAKLAEETGEELKAWFDKGVKASEDAVKDAASKASK